MKNYIILGFGCLVLLFSSCRDDVGEFLFELNYPPRTFSLPAGTNTFTAAVLSANNLPTNYPDFLAASGQSAGDVNKILPNFARLESLDGLDIGFLSEISVRICPINETNCTIADEAFYIDDLYRRNINSTGLQPGLGNFKDLLSSNLYKMEIVFFLGEIAPYTVDFRLEYGFEAYQ
ncbi:MAG: hypothetical protein AAFY48_20885 [Bacteroidota bacterium]